MDPTKSVRKVYEMYAGSCCWHIHFLIFVSVGSIDKDLLFIECVSSSWFGLFVVLHLSCED